MRLEAGLLNYFNMIKRNGSIRPRDLSSWVETAREWFATDMGFERPMTQVHAMNVQWYFKHLALHLHGRALYSKMSLWTGVLPDTVVGVLKLLINGNALRQMRALRYDLRGWESPHDEQNRRFARRGLARLNRR